MIIGADPPRSLRLVVCASTLYFEASLINEALSIPNLCLSAPILSVSCCTLRDSVNGGLYS